MHRGYIKVWRKIDDSGLIQMPNTLSLFMFLLLNASHKDKKLGTTTGIIDVKRGQYVSGRIELAKRLKQSEQQIRTSISRLEKLEIITTTSTNKYSLYTIVNYDIYQESSQQSTSESTFNQPSNNQQSTTKQECKEFKNEKNTDAVASDVDSNADDGKIPPCPHKEIIGLYERILPMLPEVLVWNAKRSKLLKDRWSWVLTETKKSGKRYAVDRQSGIDFFERYFKYVASSNFLTGRNGVWTMCNIDWLLNAGNFAKVIEGNYDK